MKGADIFEKLPPFQKSAFHLAAETSHLDAIEILLNGIKMKCEANAAKHLKTQSPLIDSMRSESFSSLIDVNGESPLHVAARENNFEACERFLMYGFDLNVKSNSEKYPHELCTNESLKKYLYGI